MEGGLGRMIHHPDYYLSDGSVSFLTGNTRFRVHRTFFERESEFFRNFFAEAAGDVPPSGTDARPIILDVTADEFATLLWVWYDKDYSYRQQTKENWLIILRLAKRWKFDKVKELAIREMEALNLPPAERISIYNQHNIDGERVVSSFVELCKSPTVPTEAEAHLLQMESLIKLLQAREDAQRKAVQLGHNSPTSASLEDEALREIVSGLIRKDSDSRSDGSSTGSGDQAPDPSSSAPTHATIANTATVTLRDPQVPDRQTKAANEVSSHPNNHPQTDSETRGSQGKERAQGVDKNTHGKVNGEASSEGKLAKAAQDKQKEEEKARAAREKQAKEKEQNTEQRSRRNASGKVWGN